MNWFNRWVNKKIRDSMNQPNVYSNDAKVSIGIDRLDRETFDRPALNFKMHRAESGWIMEVRRYDSRTDRNSTALHIINDEDDLGDNIAKIITMETLRA
jgi:hypothetical protein